MHIDVKSITGGGPGGGSLGPRSEGKPRKEPVCQNVAQRIRIFVFFSRAKMLSVPTRSPIKVERMGRYVWREMVVVHVRGLGA